jgi:hypothetical protein
MGLYKRRLDLNIENICIVLSGASTQQIEGVKNYLNISGFDSSCYDLIAIQEQPININNKILDAGLDDV